MHHFLDPAYTCEASALVSCMSGLPAPQVVAQSNTFILAGYETTANTLSFCIYSIAHDPEVQRRLVQEVDAFGRDRRVTYADLDKVRVMQLGWVVLQLCSSAALQKLGLCLRVPVLPCCFQQGSLSCTCG
jgi:hypothetical protein